MDTNVFIAALLSATGSNRAVLRACLSGKATPLMGAALFSEYEDLLAREALQKACPVSGAERRTLLESFLSVSIWVKIYYLWRPNLPDETDNHLVELALAGHADVIVTNNVRDLRGGELNFPDMQILTPNQFIKALP